MRILVTGGAGYVGSVVAAVLLSAGHRVTVLDDLSTGHRDAVPDGTDFVEASIQDAEKVLAGARFDAVLHFAAKSLVSESVAAPQLYWSNNVGGTLVLLEAMRRHGVSRIVFSSTAATYGEPTELPIPETERPQPTNPYGASKLAVDQMLAGYADAYGLTAVSLRYFNVAGAWLTGDQAFGERHATETHLIPIALEVASGAREVLQVRGTDYPTRDGTCVRDYIHVVDLADAHVRALDWTARAEVPGATRADGSGRHLICNLGSGTGATVREVAETVRRVTGRSLPVAEADRRPGDPATLIASNRLAQDEFGWRPQRTLDDMIADAWTFARRAHQ